MSQCRLGLLVLSLLVAMPSGAGVEWTCAHWTSDSAIALGEHLTIREVRWLDPGLTYQGWVGPLPVDKLGNAQFAPSPPPNPLVPVAIIDSEHPGLLRFVTRVGLPNTTFECALCGRFGSDVPTAAKRIGGSGYLRPFGGHALRGVDKLKVPLSCVRSPKSRTLVATGAVPDDLPAAPEPKHDPGPKGGKPSHGKPVVVIEPARETGLRDLFPSPGESPTPEPDEADEPKLSIAEVVGTDGRAETPPTEPKESLRDAFKPTVAAEVPGPEDAEKKSLAEELKGLGEAKARDEAEAASPIRDARVCSADLRGLEAPGSIPVEDLILAGVRGDQESARAYWFEPGLGGADPQGFQIDLRRSRGALVPVEIPEGVPVAALRSEDPDGPPKTLLPVRFRGVESAPRYPVEAAAPPPERVSRLLVVGDARTLLVAGFDDVQKSLKPKGAADAWRITWHDVLPDGSLADPLDLEGFPDLLSAASSAADKATEKVLLTDLTRFRDFLVALETAILVRERVDFVVWVKEGYPLPLQTPELFRSLIDTVHERANLPRRTPGGPPYRWLAVISGEIPGSSGAFLSEPISRTDPVPGEVFIEKRAGADRRLLERPESLALQLQLAADRAGAPDNPFDAVPAETMVIDAEDAFASLGLVLSRVGVRDLTASMEKVREQLAAIGEGASPDELAAAYAHRFDPTVLLRPQSDAAGAPVGLAYDSEAGKGYQLRLARAAKDDAETLHLHLDKAATVLRSLAEKADWGGCTHVYVADVALGFDWRRPPPSGDREP